jgi:ABC-type lipoprotein release transport system permease subunit
MILYMDLQGLIVCLGVAICFSILSYLKGFEDGFRNR